MNGRMFGADSLICVAMQLKVCVATKVSAKNIGVVGSDKLAAEFFHANRGLGVAFGANEIHASRENGDVRI